MIKISTTILLSLSVILKVYADSPLTSISFYTIYKESNIIVKAKDDAYLNQNSCKFLSSPSVSNGEKAALINALGWRFGGQHNAPVYADYLKLKYKCKKNLTVSKLSASELMCLAYLTAMDDYLHPDKAMPYIEKAVALDGKSLCIQLIHTLIVTQIQSEKDWCAAWRAYEALLMTKDILTADVKPEVLDEAEKYMILFKSSCRQ